MELAPFPARVRSVSHALYRAVDNLGGIDLVDAADVLRELKSFWTQYEYIGSPPANLHELHKRMRTSGSPYIQIDTSLSKDRYRIARYEEYAEKEAPQSWSRAVYTKAQVEKGKEKVSLKRMAKLEKIIDDPWSELRPPRKKSHSKPKVTPPPPDRDWET